MAHTFEDGTHDAIWFARLYAGMNTWERYNMDLLLAGKFVKVQWHELYRVWNEIDDRRMADESPLDEIKAIFTRHFYDGIFE